MKKSILICYLFFFYNISFGQENLNTESLKNLDALFSMELDSILAKTDKVYVSKYMWARNGGNKYKYVNSAAASLIPILIKTEKSNLYSLYTSDSTNMLLNKITDPYIMTLLDRAVLNYKFSDSTVLSINDYEAFKSKIRDKIGVDQVILSIRKYPFYTYDTHQKQFLKFFYVHHGNDLLASVKKNMDRDYTGSLQIELGTDYLNPRRLMPVKSYQTLMFGLEVYTGNIRSSSPLVDSTDRPFGGFQYIGWGKYSLSKHNKARYYTRIKIGQIGGKGGERFQNALHESISYSKLSLGWQNQIVNGGRLAYSVEYKYEYEIKTKLEKVRLQPFVEAMLGSFMTKPSLGINISNKSFAENSHHNVNLRNKQDKSYFGEHLKLNVSWKSSFVLHNSMLLGIGTLRNREKDQLQNDVIAQNLKTDIIPFSRYYLDREQIKKLIHTANFGFSYTTTYATVFYNYYIFSPETKLNTQILQNNYSFNLSQRWHKFAEAGLSFNIK